MMLAMKMVMLVNKCCGDSINFTRKQGSQRRKHHGLGDSAVLLTSNKEVSVRVLQEIKAIENGTMQ